MDHKNQQSAEWTVAHEHNGDRIEVRPSGIGHGYVTIRASAGGITISPSDWGRIAGAVIGAQGATPIQHEDQRIAKEAMLNAVDHIPGPVTGGFECVAQQSQAPGKMFSRAEILAILRGRLATLKASAPDVPESARFEIEYAIRIFEHLE